MKNLKWILVILCISLIHLLVAQTKEDSLKCAQFDLAIGLSPRIIIDQENNLIQLEFPGFPYINYYQFKDSVTTWADTVETFFPKVGYIRNKEGKKIKPTKLNKNFTKSNYKALLSEKNHELVGVTIKDFNKDSNDDILIVGKGKLPAFMDTKKEGYYISTFLNQVGKFIEIKNCTCLVWTKIEGYIITDIEYNNLPVIIIIHEGDTPELTKRMRIIYNQ